MAKKEKFLHVRAVSAPGRPKAYGWMFRSTRKSQWYETAEERDRDMRRAERRVQQHGRDLLSLDVNLHRRVLDWMERFGVRVDDLEAVGRIWERHGSGGNGLTVQDAIREYLDYLEGDVTTDTLRHVRKNLQRFAEACPVEEIGQVGSDWLQEWLDRGLGHFADYTRQGHRKTVRAMFNYFLQRGKVAENPVVYTRAIRVVRDPITVLSVAEGRQLFAASRNNPIVGRLALEAFAGLRASTAGAVTAEMVHAESNAIEFPARVVKTEKRSGRRKYRAGYPDNVFRWIQHAGKDGWRVRGKDYERAKGRAFLVAGVENAGNVLRHTFASAYYAMTQDLAKTAELCLHAKPKTTEDHYAGRMSRADGEAWFEIVPDTPQKKSQKR